jgi:predicted  nucleic acid-binding Zn-ribbon protein
MAKLTKAKLTKLEKLRAQYEKLKRRADKLDDLTAKLGKKIDATGVIPYDIYHIGKGSLKTIKALAKYGPSIAKANDEWSKIDIKLDDIGDEIDRLEAEEASADLDASAEEEE